MATIQLVFDGSDASPRIAWVDLPLGEAIKLFELKPDDFVSDSSASLKNRNQERHPRIFPHRHSVIEIGREEGRRDRWKPGFYRSKIEPKEAFRLLIEQAFAAELGPENVLEVAYGPTVDSQGRDALEIKVVIAPEAISEMKVGASLHALVRLQKRLHEMGDDRTPIVRYATKAELAQDATS